MCNIMYINIKYHLHLFTILSKEKKYGLVWFFISTQTKTTKNTGISASGDRKINRFVTSNTIQEI
jgi:nicotinamide mononucleotide (NMN) deamidase PncC